MMISPFKMLFLQGKPIFFNITSKKYLKILQMVKKRSLLLKELNFKMKHILVVIII